MVEISIEGAEALVVDFQEKPARISRAMVRALNRSINSGRTVMVREIARDTGLKSSTVRESMRTREASLAHPEAQLATNLKRIPLIKFGASGPRPSRGRGRGVSYRLPGGKGRLPTAFLATMRSGHEGVFMRKTRSRLPIKELFGPSLGHVFAKFRPVGLARMRDVFMKNMEHELEFAKTEGGGVEAD